MKREGRVRWAWTECEGVGEAVKLCEQQNLTRILTDIRTVDKDIALLDRFKLGTELGRLLGPKYKLAILARAESIDKMGENAAVNRGARVFVTASLDEALSWFDSNS